jgi:hypothetical protein
MTSNVQWSIQGDYFESCSCDYLCPCLPGNLTAPMTKGYCDFAMVFQIGQGNYGNTRLDGLNFAVVGRMPGDTGSAGNWSVGLILDERANSEQQQALTVIGSGQAGGPMSVLSDLVGNFLGAELRPIHYQKSGLNRSVSIPGVLDQAIEGVPGAKQDEPLYMDNTIHPANSRLALAKATRSHLHAFGLDWDDDSGRNNGHFAPFQWSGP